MGSATALPSFIRPTTHCRGRDPSAATPYPLPHQLSTIEVRHRGDATSLFFCVIFGPKLRKKSERPRFETRLSPDSLAACPRGFAFYLAVAVGYVAMPATTWSSSR